MDLNEINPPGVTINIITKHSDYNLNQNISDIIRLLCREHLKPCVLYPSRYTTSCTINDVRLTDNIIENFLSDFCRHLEETIGAKEFIEADKKIDFKDFEVCQRCNVDIPISDVKKLFKPKYKSEFIYCPDCYEIETNKLIQHEKESSKDIRKVDEISKPVNDAIKEEIPDKKEINWKVIGIIGVLIAMGISILALIQIFFKIF